MIEKRGAFDRLSRPSHGDPSLGKDLAEFIGGLFGCIMTLVLGFIGLVFTIWLLKTIWRAV